LSLVRTILIQHLTLARCSVLLLLATLGDLSEPVAESLYKPVRHSMAGGWLGRRLAIIRCGHLGRLHRQTISVRISSGAPDTIRTPAPDGKPDAPRPRRSAASPKPNSRACLQPIRAASCLEGLNSLNAEQGLKGKRDKVQGLAGPNSRQSSDQKLSIWGTKKAGQTKWK
jgi:hypothetical protein